MVRSFDEMDETEVETVERLRAADVRDLFPTAAPDDADARVCLLCAATLKDKTHNLTRHLERRHAAALLRLMEQRAAAVAPVTPVAAPAKRIRVRSSRAKTTAGAVAASERASNKRRHDTVQESDTDSDDTVAAAAAKEEEQSGRAENARRALVRWLALEQLPISLVESDGFRAFTHALNGRFGAMASDDVQRMLADMHSQADATCTAQEQQRTQEAQATESLKQKQTLTRRQPIVATRALVAAARTSDDASRVRYQQLPCGALSSGWVRVRVCAALATHWDARACKEQLCGRRGVLGRVFVGVVVQSHQRDASAPREHQRVVLGSSRLRLGDVDRRTTGEYFGVDSSRGALTEYVEVPETSVHALPSTVPDDLALLTSDLALVLRVGDELKKRGAKKVVVIADGVAGCLTTLLTWYVRRELGLAPDDIRVVVVGSIGQRLQTQLVQYATLVTQSASASGSPLVIDMCASDSSADLAIRLTEPMGTLLTIDRARFEAASAVLAVDMNAVVVNELEMVAIGECSSVDDAIAYLAYQESKGSTQELRALLSAPVALDDALEELRALPLESLQAQYVHVKVPAVFA